MGSRIVESSNDSGCGLNPPLKVLYLDSSMIIAGGQKVLLDMISTIDRSLIEPVLFAPRDSELISKCRHIGVECHVSPIRSAYHCYAGFTNSIVDLMGALYGILYVGFKARKLGAKIIHANNFKSALVAGFSALIAGIPLVYHDHSLKRHRLFEWLVGRRASRIIAVSQGVARKYSEKDRRKVVILRGVSIDPEKNQSSICKSKHIGYLGRISWEKGLDLLLMAASKLASHYNDLRILIAGRPVTSEDLTYLEAIRGLIRKLGLSNKVEFLGQVSDASEFLRGLRVLALPSRRDAMSLTMLEAMGFGIPVVAFRSGGAEEVITDGETGFLVDQFDIDGFALALENLLEDDELAMRIGRNAQLTIKQNYSMNSVLEQLQKIYAEVVRRFEDKARTNKND